VREKLSGGRSGPSRQKDAARGGRPVLARSNSFLPVFLRYWLPVLVYVAIIFALSSIANLSAPVRWNNADKMAHLVEYTLLGFLLARAFYGARIFSSLVACALLGIVAGIATGIADEIFQAGVPGRVSSAADFRVDAIGVVLGSAVYAFLRRLRSDD
jgi:VanZ family protein